jgi:cytochrome c553
VRFQVVNFFRNCKSSLQHHAVAWLISLCVLCVLCVSVVSAARVMFTTETQRTQKLHRDFLLFAPQGPELDYSNFKHSSQRHASLGCTSCHQRTSDNSATPRFPGHNACTSCHLAQFVTPNVPMCVICHMDVNSSNPPLRNFPTKFNESFNVKFDHSQHMTGSARPQAGCSACHSRIGGRAAALGIASSISAHVRQQISIGKRNRFMWGLSRPKILRANLGQRALFSFRVQPRQTWQRATFGLSGLSFAYGRRAANPSGQFARTR